MHRQKISSTVMTSNGKHQHITYVRIGRLVTDRYKMFGLVTFIKDETSIKLRLSITPVDQLLKPRLLDLIQATYQPPPQQHTSKTENTGNENGKKTLKLYNKK